MHLRHNCSSSNNSSEAFLSCDVFSNCVLSLPVRALSLVQVLRNVASLTMMDFPVEIVKAQLLKSIGRTPMGDVLKVGIVYCLH